jgi:hypothetical protein
MTFLSFTGAVPGSSFGWETGKSWQVSHHFLLLYRQTLGQYLELRILHLLPSPTFILLHSRSPYSTLRRPSWWRMFNQAYTFSHTNIQGNLQLSFNLPLLLLILYFVSFLHFVLQLNYSSTSDIPVASDVRRNRSTSDTDCSNSATLTKQNLPNIFRRAAEDTIQFLETTKSFY